MDVKEKDSEADSGNWETDRGNQATASASADSKLDPSSSPHSSSEPEEFPVISEEGRQGHSWQSYIKRRGAEVAEKSERPRRRPRRTITDSEQLTFYGLLRQINDMHKPEEKKRSWNNKNPELGKIQTRRKNDWGQEVRQGTDEEMDKLPPISDELLDETREALHDTYPDPWEFGQRLVDDEDTRGEETPTPRKAALRTMSELETKPLKDVFARLRKDRYSHYDEEEDGPNDTFDPVPVHVGIDLVVRREAAKIEAELVAAAQQERGDFGIWNVCKERIFSMTRLLEDKRHGGEPKEASPASDDPIHRETRATSSKESSTLEIPPFIPIEPVILSLYPEMLLVALRLLNREYPASPLIASFSSFVRTQGRESSIIGTSTNLYNELLSYYWDGCKDLSSVISLLREMEVTGVEADRETLIILHKISRRRRADVEATKRIVNRGDGVDRMVVPWWDIGPTRRAYRELEAPGGWIDKLEARAKRKQQSQLWQR